MPNYLEYPVVAVDWVAVVSFFCAQAPKLNTPAATATIMIILTNFTINSPPSLAGCCRLFRRGTQCAQRISRPFFLRLNHDFGTERDPVEKRDQIGILHANAAVTGRLANLVFTIGAVDVNEAVACVGIVFLKAVEP